LTLRRTARTIDRVTATTVPVDTIHQLAGRLTRAERQRRPIAPLSAMIPALTVRDAYAIQDAIVRHRLDAGEWVVGWKIGLTSRAMQEQLETDEPDHAPILSDWLIPEGEAIPIDGLIQPRIVAQVAFELARQLAGPGITPADVVAATGGLRAAVEVIDSRIEDWRIRLPDTIADMTSSARVIVGERLTPADDLDLRHIGVAIERNGKGVATGQGSAVLGDPAEAVAWAANTLGRLGVTLEVGHIIMAGALHPSVPASRGDAFRAIFDRLGSVSVAFV